MEKQVPSKRRRICTLERELWKVSGQSKLLLSKE